MLTAKSKVILTGGQKFLFLCRRLSKMYTPPDPSALGILNPGLAKRQVDLRSDTLTKPTDLMRQAAYVAEVGDDALGEDPTMNCLQERVAKQMKKEDALFVSSGTMGNLIAILSHCELRGEYALVGDKSHILHYEGGGAPELGGVMLHTIPMKNDGTFDLKEVEQRLGRLLCIENTFNGIVIPLQYLNDVSTLVKGCGALLHMDGARLFNAVVRLGVPVHEIVKHVDSVTFCFSKGLGCPVGSMLVGTRCFIQRARRLRHVLGGQMRQVGILAAYAHVALDCMIDRLAEDHTRMEQIVRAIQETKSPNITTEYGDRHTNMAIIHINPKCGNAEEFRTRLATVSEKELQDLGESAVSIQCYPLSSHSVRFVSHNDISDEDICHVITKLKYIISMYDQIAK